MNVLGAIAVRHILARKRQSLVSLMGIVLGVAFFLAVSSLMRGSEQDFIARLVDNAPHIIISDEYRTPRKQPAETVFADATVEISNVKPLAENRGIRGYRQIVDLIRQSAGVEAAASLVGQGIITFAGRDVGISLNGMVPEDIDDVTTIRNYMIAGRVDDLSINPDGIIIGSELARMLSLDRGDNISVAASTGQVRTMKILGIFRTGRADYDRAQAFVHLKRAEALLDRPNRANSIIIKLPDPHQARAYAATLESRIGYKAVSWQESFEDLMNTLAIRNIIMYSVVSAILIVASFGIYNVISTVVMEKHKDIAILKSMGFQPRDIRLIFVIQGIILGLAGSVLGIALGCVLMLGLGQVELMPPGMTEPIRMPLSWEPQQFLLAAAFALASSVFAAWLPARKGATLPPVDILRGAA